MILKISKELKIGVVSILTIVAFYWLFKFLQGENLFTKGNIYYVEYSNVDGLLPTKPVNVNGLRVGRVDDIAIKEGKDSLYFVVKLILEKELDFTKNTVAEIYEPGIMAGKMINLKLSYEGEPAKSGDYLKPAINLSMLTMLSDELSPTKKKLDSVLVSLDGTLNRFSSLADEQTNQSLKQVLKELDGSLKAISKTANSLTQTSGNTNRLVLDVAELSSDTKDLMQTANSTMAKYGDVAQNINDGEIKATLSNLNKATESLNATLTRFENANGTINQAINDPALYDNLNKTAKNLNLLIEDFNQNPDKYIHFSVFGKKEKKVKNKDAEK